MKRKALIKDLVRGGCFLKRHDSKHDIYANPRNGKQSPIPGHPEIKDSLVRLTNQKATRNMSSGTDITLAGVRRTTTRKY